MAFGFTPHTPASPSASADSAARLGRILEPAEWASAGIPLLRNPREIVSGLYERHHPVPSTAVVAVLNPQQRVIASASFSEPAEEADGWKLRNVLLPHLRRVVPHDLRLRVPVRTAVLLYCREGEPRWTETDGAWMWGLRDACTLHGLRCGAYITLTRDRWQVLGEKRGGRRPREHRGELPKPRGPLAGSAADGRGSPASARAVPQGPGGGQPGVPERAGAAGPCRPPETPRPAARAQMPERSRHGSGTAPRAGGGAAKAERHAAAR
ncbi:hypothetical protein LIU39_03120 [Streptomyces sp. SF28]|nr:hypothetical protein [Streptomyces pinistramenti]MCB5906428.1 hypothetical protein [Streptomyces pinistramenti]